MKPLKCQLPTPRASSPRSVGFVAINPRPLQRPTASTTRRVRYRSVRVAAAAAAAPAHAAAAVAVLLHLVLLVLLLEGVLQDVGTHGTGAHSRDGAKHATAGLVRRPAGRAAAYQRGAEAALALRPAGATGAAGATGILLLAGRAAAVRGSRAAAVLRLATVAAMLLLLAAVLRLLLVIRGLRGVSAVVVAALLLGVRGLLLVATALLVWRLAVGGVLLGVGRVGLLRVLLLDVALSAKVRGNQGRIMSLTCWG